MKHQCVICKAELAPREAYEYRGIFSCSEHFDEAIAKRDFQRKEIIAEERAKTDIFRGLDLSTETVIGRANREILKPQIEIASKESGRLKEYERKGE